MKKFKCWDKVKFGKEHLARCPSLKGLKGVIIGIQPFNEFTLAEIKLKGVKKPFKSLTCNLTKTR